MMRLPLEVSFASAPGSLADGVYGDITVSTGTTVWTINNGVVTNVKLATMAANTVKANATAGVATPTDIALAASQLFGRGAAGDIAPIILGTNLSMSGTTLNASGSGGGVTDGDKGDITVTASGATWTIDAGVVTLAKQANMATSSLVYRKTAGSGAPEINTLATLKTDLGLTGTNSGDQASIVGITGTKAQFDTAVTDGNIMYIGDAPTAHTHVAANVTDFSAAADARIGAASINALGDVVITAPSTGQVVKYDGTNWTNQADATGGGGVSDGDKGDITVSGAGAVWTVDAAAITLAKQADMATGSLVYRKTAAAGPPEVQTLATLKTDLGLTGVNGGDQTITLTADVTGSGTGSFAATIAADAVTNTKLANMAANSFKINNTGAAADPIDGTVAQVKTLLAYTPADIGAATSAQANATHTGDATGATALTLATVNGNVGSFGLAASVAQFVVNAKGLITSAANVAISIASTAISDFASASRAQTEAELVAGTNVTITPSGTGATRQLTIASTASGGGAVIVQDEGVNITTAVGTMNFVGAGVTVTGGATATVTIPGGGSGSSLLVENVQSGTTYTYVATDIDKMITGTGANPAFTIPLNAAVAFAIGTQFTTRFTGTGSMTVNITGAGTINGITAGSFILDVGQEAQFWKTGTDAWEVVISPANVFGSIAAMSGLTFY